MDDEKLIQKIANMLNKSKNTVVVTGAGISTEAGIPDFRGDKGIYRVLGEDNVLNLLNIDTFRTNPRGFYDFYRNYFMMPKVEPSRLTMPISSDISSSCVVNSLLSTVSHPPSVVY